MSIDAYQTKQNRIYRQFQTAMETLPAVQASPLVAEPAAGYIVAWLHADALMERLAQVNAQINEIIPVMRFDGSNAHTTITVYELQQANKFQLNEQTLQSLTTACFEIDDSLLQAVRIQFDQWLFKEDAVIAAGRPNDAFWQVGEALQTAGKKHGLELRMPWGAHITAARYLTDSDEVADLTALLRQTPGLGESRPKAIVVGHFTCGPTGLQLHQHAIKNTERNEMPTCYMCERPATSKEHVPPQCFFPKAKDLPKGVSLRKDLITVPSCDLHNTEKSKDDEYLRMVMLTHIENNLVAQRHFAKSVRRSMIKNPFLLTLLNNLQPVVDSEGNLLAATFVVDHARFNNALDQIVRALYFHTYGERWSGNVKTVCNALMMKSYENFLGAAQYNVELKIAFNNVRKLLNPQEKSGNNQSVFYYQIFRSEHPRTAVAMRLVFYEGVEVIAILSDEIA